MTPLVKTGIVGGVLTSLGGATYVGLTYFSSPTEEVSKLIEKENTHILLNTATGQDTEQWSKNWENYKSQNLNKDKDIFELTGWKKDGTANVTEELKKKCNSLKDIKVYNSKDDLYKNITNYCGRYITVKDEAKKKGLTVLDTAVSDTSTGVWAEKNKGKATLQKDIEKLGMTFLNIDANGIKNGCKKAENKSKELTEYKDIYESYVKVCTNPKTAEE